MTWWLILILSLCGAAILLVAVGLLVGEVFFSIGIPRLSGLRNRKRNDGRPTPSYWQKAEKEIREPTPQELSAMSGSKRVVEELCGKEQREGQRFILAQNPERIYQKSHDGLILCAHYVDVPNAKATILMTHGYRSHPMNDFSTAVPAFAAAGCACLMLHQRAHEESEGRYICYGAKEKYDVQMWSEYLAKRFPGRPIVYDGVSMGAATVMMASGLDLPPEVRAIIADCGYTTPKAIFSHVLRRYYRLPPRPVLFFATPVVKRRAGFDIGGAEADTREALKHNRLPILFAHGLADDFVSCRMSEENYAIAKENCEAELFLVPNADHGLAYIIDRPGYIAAINRLFKRAGIDAVVE